MAAEGGGDVGLGGHGGVDGHVVWRQRGVRLRRTRIRGLGHGMATNGVRGALRCKVGGGRHGEGGKTKFTENLRKLVNEKYVGGKIIVSYLKYG